MALRWVADEEEQPSQARAAPVQAAPAQSEILAAISGLSQKMDSQIGDPAKGVEAKLQAYAAATEGRFSAITSQVDRLEKELRSRGSQGQVRQTGVCFKCNKLGHFARHCKTGSGNARPHGCTQE